MIETLTVEPTIQLSSLSISEIAGLISDNWSNPYFGAQPYLSAMFSLNSVNDSYGADGGRSVVAYFLCNATRWKGPIAKAVKTELNKRIKR